MDDIPAGLDDLLNSIRGGSSSALVRRERQLATENIDETILRILNLDDVSDLDYDTYKVLLRERMAAGRMPKTSIPTEETQILTEEFKRVKSKEGRFKPKKVKKEKVFNTKVRGSLSGSVSGRKLLPSGTVSKVEEVAESKELKKDSFLTSVLGPAITSIEKNIASISETLTKQFALEKKQAENLRKSDIKERKEKREQKLESSMGSSLKNIRDKVIKPAENIFDLIKKFLVNTLIGGALLNLLKIIENPNLILEPFYNFINGIIDFLERTLQFVVDIPYNAFNFIIENLNTGMNALQKQINDALALFGIPAATLFTPIAPLVAPQIEIPRLELPAEEVSFAGGGPISESSGVTITGLGPDTQLIAAQPGEVVMSRSAVDMFGMDNLLAMNAAGGGTNRPGSGYISTFSGGGGIRKAVQAFQNGGVVGSDYGINQVNRGSLGTPTMGTAPKGILLVPGHYGYGGGTPGATRGGLARKHGMAQGWDEYLANRMIAQHVVQQVKATDPSINIRFYEKSGGFENSNQGLKDAIAHYKSLEEQGYEVIELHHDAYGSQGSGAGLLGSYTNYSALDRRLAELGGNFGFGYKGRFENGYGMNRGGISMFEVAKLEGDYEQGLIRGDRGAVEAGAAPIVAAITDVYGKAGGGARPKVEVDVPAPPAAATVSPVYVPPPQQSPGSVPLSSASPSQKTVPSFSAVDQNNSELIVIKSIYNIVG